MINLSLGVCLMKSHLKFDDFIKNYNLYWIGPRESDIDAVKYLFAGSVTFFGNGEKTGYRENSDIPVECRGNHTMSRTSNVDHNDLSDKSMDRFIYRTVKDIKKKDSRAKFYMYNANVLRQDKGETTDGEDTFLPSEFVEENYICINNKLTMEAMDSKKLFHNLFAKELGGENHLLDIVIKSGNEINSYHSLCGYLNVDPFSGTRFIVQEIFASGGAGTHIVAKPRHEEGLSFKPNEDYLCSVLQEDNISVNAHIIIFDDDILLLTPSVQIIRENNNRLMYRGADFITYRNLPEKVRVKFENLCARISLKYQKEFKIDGDKEDRPSYRGVLGLDAIIQNGEVEMLECNNRFQSSSNLLNLALRDAGLPSLQEMNFAACNDGKLSDIIKGCGGDKFRAVETDGGLKYTAVDLGEVNYSNFSFVDSGNNYEHARNIYKVANKLLEDKNNKCGIVSLETDGYRDDIKYKPFSHLFRITFRTNITSISPEGTLRLNENVCEPTRTWMDKIFDCDPLATKISLLVQGLSECNVGEYREATNNAIDVHLNKPIAVSSPENYTEMVVNAPLNVKFCEFSPFALVESEGRFTLKYYDKPINDNVTLFRVDELSRKVTKNGIPYSKIAFLSGDRLRVHVSDVCFFKQCGKSCSFCNMDVGNSKTYEFGDDDLREVVNAYWEKKEYYNLEHFLVGGQSPDGNAQEKIVKTIKIIKEVTGSDRIYVMVLPPKSEEGFVKNILEMVKAGANEFSFNLEIFDDILAKRYMKGKADKFTREDYLNALITARYVIDDKYPENVRTMFVVGLEGMSSLKRGLRAVIDNGIQPMLSVFRPLPDTELADEMPPKLSELYELFGVVEKWCEEKGLHLGPACLYCQNNTLSLPY